MIAKLQSNCKREKLLVLVLDGPTRVDAQLDLLFTIQEDLAGDVILMAALAAVTTNRGG